MIPRRERRQEIVSVVPSLRRTETKSGNCTEPHDAGQGSTTLPADQGLAGPQRGPGGRWTGHWAERWGGEAWWWARRETSLVAVSRSLVQNSRTNSPESKDSVETCGARPIRGPPGSRPIFDVGDHGGPWRTMISMVHRGCVPARLDWAWSSSLRRPLDDLKHHH